MMMQNPNVRHELWPPKETGLYTRSPVHTSSEDGHRGGVLQCLPPQGRYACSAPHVAAFHGTRLRLLRRGRRRSTGRSSARSCRHSCRKAWRCNRWRGGQRSIGRLIHRGSACAGCYGGQRVSCQLR